MLGVINSSAFAFRWLQVGKEKRPVKLAFRHILKNCNQVAVVFLVIVLSACSSTSSVEPGSGDPKDPLESINRPFWTFTWDYADKYIAKPASNAYVEYTPEFLRSGLYNMALNLKNRNFLKLLDFSPKEINGWHIQTIVLKEIKQQTNSCWKETTVL